jgi:hypothetical protein
MADGSAGVIGGGVNPPPSTSPPQLSHPPPAPVQDQGRKDDGGEEGGGEKVEEEGVGEEGVGKEGGEAGEKKGEGEWNDAAVLSWATGGFRKVAYMGDSNVMAGVDKSTGHCFQFSPSTGEQGGLLGHFSSATGTFTSFEMTAEEADALRMRLSAYDAKMAKEGGGTGPGGADMD